MNTSGEQVRNEIVATEPHQLVQRSNSLVSRGLALDCAASHGHTEVSKYLSS